MPRKVLVWIFRPDGRVLLLRRARAPSVPGWHPVTGNVEEGEDLANAARREVEEETGLVVEVRPLGIMTEFERYGNRLEEHAFLAAASGEARISPEHDALEWVTVAEAAARVAFPFQRETLVEAARRIGRGGDRGGS